MGMIFRERREQLGKDIKEIAQITKIKKTLLIAIEGEDFGKLPIEVYSRGYIREYAKFLDIPCDDILSRYEAYLARAGGTNSYDAKADVNISQDVSHSTGPVNAQKSINNIALAHPAVYNNLNAKGFWSSSGPVSRKVFWLIPALFFLLIIYFYLPASDNVPKPVTVIPAVVLPPPAPPQAPVQQEIVKEKPAPSPPVSGTGVVPAAAKPVPVVRKKHNLEITATDKCWIHVVIDGSETNEILLQPGEKLGYGANTSFALRIGNAGGLKLNYDGKEFNNLGEKGQVIVLDFPELAKIQASPKPPGDTKAPLPTTTTPSGT
jgi:cytoskeletal protein RodZ